MNKKKSAGILLYRLRNREPEFFLLHPGGPFWKKKDAGAWSIPKGEFGEGEDALETARREFREETGQEIKGNFLPLTPIRQKGGKTVYAWAVEGDVDADAIQSNFFEMEWPPHSGRKQSFPEIERGAWFPPGIAREKINEAQCVLIDELTGILRTGSDNNHS